MPLLIGSLSLYLLYCEYKRYKIEKKEELKNKKFNFFKTKYL